MSSVIIRREPANEAVEKAPSEDGQARMFLFQYTDSYPLAQPTFYN
jgi:hypothetical protein